MDKVYLFTPGDSIKKMKKAFASDADVVIIDLEDGVSFQHKEQARESISMLLKNIIDQSAVRKKVMLRVNPITSSCFHDDVRFIQELQLDGIMIAKCEGQAEINVIKDVRNDVEIMPLVESALGIQNLPTIVSSSEQIKRVAFGSVDFALDIGVEWSVEGEERKYAMSQLVLLSRVLGLDSPLDAVFPLIDDQQAFLSDAQYGKKIGFYGKIVIHPKQIEWVHNIYSITDKQVEWSRKVIQAYEMHDSLGSIEMEGKLIDLPVYKIAKRLLAAQKSD